MFQPTESLAGLTPKDEKYYVGIGLAIISSGFIGTSFIIKKLALIKLTNLGHVRAGAGGYGYIKDWMWWCGFLLLGIGELANFAAYIFAPASLITPLGALSVLISTVLAARFLGDNLAVLGKIGCLLCIIGAIIFIIHAPKEEEIQSIQELIELFDQSYFSYYVICILVFIVVTILYAGPRYGSRYVWIYVSLCSAVGSLTVMACKTLGVAIKEAARGDVTTTTKLLAASLVFAVLLCITLQMNYLNKALDLFSTSIVTPVYYVMFTTLVIVASALLLKEWKHMTLKDTLGTAGGFVIITVAIYLLNAYKETSNSKDLSKVSQPLLRRNHRMFAHSV